jgi:hypothetical protein
MPRGATLHLLVRSLANPSNWLPPIPPAISERCNLGELEQNRERRVKCRSEIATIIGTRLYAHSGQERTRDNRFGTHPCSGGSSFQKRGSATRRPKRYERIQGQRAGPARKNRPSARFALSPRDGQQASLVAAQNPAHPPPAPSRIHLAQTLRPLAFRRLSGALLVPGEMNQITMRGARA